MRTSIISSGTREKLTLGMNRLALWGRRRGIASKLAVALALAAVASGIATYLSLSPSTGGGTDHPWLTRVLLLIDLVLLLLLMAVVARRLVRLWVERRRGSAGSKLHTRIVALFSAVAVAPAIVMAIFSALFLNLGVEAWFSDRVNTAVGESVAVAEAYIQEHRKVIQADILAMAADLNREAPRLSRNAALFAQVVTGQARLRSLGEVMIFTGSGQVLARSALSLSMEFERVPPWALEQAAAGEVVVLTGDSDDRLRALVRLDGFLDSYLYVGRFVERGVIDHLERTRAAAAQYKQMESERSGFEITFAALFIVVSLMLLLSAIWFGLSIATRLVRPIGAMVVAAERVRQGDYSSNVPEGETDDEMATLSRAFNRMTTQLSTQRSELVEANRQIDDRRRFTETVLAGVSAGVIGIGRDGNITLPNPSATLLLDAAADKLVGRPFSDAVPEMAALFAEAAMRASERPVQGQVILTRNGTSRTLLVRVARETTGDQTVGYVVTFDDITELVSAQRTAAWADVARRIAHEIKNPLTPIQLSAERLRRKYTKEIVSDPEVFARCTETIIRQVGDIGRMVDEFSAFARMPAPTFKPENLNELVKQSVFLQQIAHPEIDYVTDLLPGDAIMRCDGRQIAQVLTNLLQNGADAIEGRSAADGGALPRGRIVTHSSRADDGALLLEILDNGRGLPREQRERLTEPYVTHRVKGTGLGLAIVKKIVEEHGGTLALDDNPTGGACIRLSFPSSIVLSNETGDGTAVESPRQRAGKASYGG